MVDHVTVRHLYRYVMNYSPFDITYKFYQFLPIRALIACLKEIHRANKVYRGVTYAMRAYPQSYVIIFTVGALKGIRLRFHIIGLHSTS